MGWEDQLRVTNSNLPNPRVCSFLQWSQSEYWLCCRPCQCATPLKRMRKATWWRWGTVVKNSWNKSSEWISICVTLDRRWISNWMGTTLKLIKIRISGLTKDFEVPKDRTRYILCFCCCWDTCCPNRAAIRCLARENIIRTSTCLQNNAVDRLGRLC